MTNIQFDANRKCGQGASLVFLTCDQLKKVSSSHVLPSEAKRHLVTLLDAKRFSAKSQEVAPYYVGKYPIMFVGLGEEKDLTKASFCRTVKYALESSYLKDDNTLGVFFLPPDEQKILWAIDAIKIGMYRWKKYVRSGTPEKTRTICINSGAKKVFYEQTVICDGVNFTRDLINDNADVSHSIFLEKQLRSLTRSDRRVRLEVLGESDLRRKGLNLHLAVNKASQYPPRLLVARYSGAEKSKTFTAIVGKGITFDTGGLNLKPTGSMETMRDDMSGAAAVLGILKNVMALGLKVNVVFVAAIAENAIGPGAYKPGDVIKSYDGKTVEIGNTDAEGRLVLADALSYIAKNYKPSQMIDLATLTGACVVALGYDHSGLMTNDEKLAKDLLRCSQQTDDRLWQLPLYAELKDNLKSQYADLKSTGLPKGAGGTISAAEFLRQFVGKIPWAHLDIAGTAFVEGPGRSYFNYGATGSGVRLLTKFLMDIAS